MKHRPSPFRLKSPGSNTTPVVSKRHRRYEEICEEIPGPWNKQRRRERGLNHLVSFSCEVEMWKETFYVLWSLLSHHFLFHHLSLYQYQSFWFQFDVGTRTVDFFLALLLWFSLSLSSVILCQALFDLHAQNEVSRSLEVPTICYL